MATLAKHIVRLHGFGLLVVGMFFLALGLSFAHAAAGKLTVWQLLVCRAVIYLLVLIPWGVRHPRDAWGVNRADLLLRGIFGTALVGLTVYTLSLMPLPTATVLGKTAPLWSILMLWLLFAVRPVLTEVAAVPLTLAGIVLILHPEGQQSLGGIGLLAVCVALSAGLFNALEYLTLHRLRQTDDAPTINLWYGGVVLLVALPLTLAQPGPASPSFWLLGILFGASSLLGQMLLAQSMKRVSSIAASTGALLVPVFATLLGLFYFGQHLSWLELVGIVLVLGAGGMVIRVDNLHKRGGGLVTFRWQRRPPPSGEGVK